MRSPLARSCARDARFAIAFWPWFLLAQREPLPERLVAADPEIVVEHALGEWGSDPATFSRAVRAAYVEALRDSAAVHAICEEYRAAVTVDFREDVEAQESQRRIARPTLVLWAAGGSLDYWYEDAGGPLGIWSNWATDVTGRSIPAGHFFPEENATETISELRSFFHPIRER